MRFSGKSRRHAKNNQLVVGLILSAAVLLVAPATLAQQNSTATTAQQLAEEIKSARAAVRDNPENASTYLQLADLLKKSGRNQEAVQEYEKASKIQPNLFVAYHQISLICSDEAVLDEAISRLNTLKEKNSNDLMLRVALSELLEKKKNYYSAAKALIELQYANAIPVKYKPRVEARIHYLLTKTKEAQLKEQEPSTTSDNEEMDVVPAPLPDSSLRKGLTASKIKESKELKGMGHVPLLP